VPGQPLAPGNRIWICDRNAKPVQGSSASGGASTLHGYVQWDMKLTSDANSTDLLKHVLDNLYWSTLTSTAVAAA